eukprot:Rmarinus@m.10040
MSAPATDLRLVEPCSNCGNEDDFVEDTKAGDYICRSCGFVMEERMIDAGSEWRTFSDSKPGHDPNRASAPTDALGGAATTAMNVTRHTEGKETDFRSLARLHDQRSTSAQRSLLEAYKEIDHFCELGEIVPAIRDRAKEIYHVALEKKLTKGKTRLSVVCCCLYFACKGARVTRSVKELCHLTNVAQKDMTRCMKQLQKDEVIHKLINQSSHVVESRDFMKRYCSDLGLHQLEAMLASTVSKNVRIAGAVGSRTPQSVAAAAIYYVVQLTDEQLKPGLDRSARAAEWRRKIAEVSNVAEATLRSAYKDIYQHEWAYHRASADALRAVEEIRTQARPVAEVLRRTAGTIRDMSNIGVSGTVFEMRKRRWMMGSRIVQLYADIFHEQGLGQFEPALLECVDEALEVFDTVSEDVVAFSGGTFSFVGPAALLPRLRQASTPFLCAAPLRGRVTGKSVSEYEFPSGCHVYVRDRESVPEKKLLGRRPYSKVVELGLKAIKSTEEVGALAAEVARRIIKNSHQNEFVRKRLLVRLSRLPSALSQIQPLWKTMLVQELDCARARERFLGSVEEIRLATKNAERLKELARFIVKLPSMQDEKASARILTIFEQEMTKAGLAETFPVLQETLRTLDIPDAERGSIGTVPAFSSLLPMDFTPTVAFKDLPDAAPLGR